MSAATRQHELSINAVNAARHWAELRLLMAKRNGEGMSAGQIRNVQMRLSVACTYACTR